MITVLAEAEDPKALLSFTFTLHQNTQETGADLFKSIQKLSKDAKIVDASAHQLRAQVPRSIIHSIAQIDYVEVIEQTKLVELTVSKANEALKAGDGLKPNKIFQGNNEIIAIADGGFDKGVVDNVHPAFKDRVLSIADFRIASEEKFPLDDPIGHGTHVAGCALGSYINPALVGKDFLRTDPYRVQQIQSPAPKAKLFFQVITPGKNIIPDMDRLFRPQGLINFKVHSNSWGARPVARGQDQEAYTAAESFKVDKGMFDNPELLIVWSVGNDGEKWQNLNGTQVLRQAGDLAAAKNALVVGATFNNRYTARGNSEKSVDGEADPTSNSDHFGAGICLDFSSKGPTTDMRVKPDVVAPGVAILSALSRAVKSNQAVLDEEHNGLRPDKSLVWMSGTSHAAPLVAGCAAALREAVKSKGTTSPSGALIKALLVNGAVDLAGSQYAYTDVHGTKQHLIMPRAPNGIQGHGRVDLDRSLRCVWPLVRDQGGFWEEKHVQVVSPTHAAWARPLAIPKDKRVLRVTLAYTDPPGNITNDEIYLSVETVDAKKGTLSIVQPDVPTNPAYEDTNALPVYAQVNNLQKVTLNIDNKAAVALVIHVTPVTLAVNTLAAFSVVYFFDSA